MTADSAVVEEMPTSYDARTLRAGAYSAWLKKIKSDGAKAKWFSTSTTRYFTIDFDAQIFYYSHSEGQKKISNPIRFSELLGAERLPTPARASKKGKASLSCGFLVRTLERTYELYTTTNADAAQWTYAVNAAKEIAARTPPALVNGGQASPVHLRTRVDSMASLLDPANGQVAGGQQPLPQPQQQAQKPWEAQLPVQLQAPQQHQQPQPQVLQESLATPFCERGTTVGAAAVGPEGQSQVPAVQMLAVGQALAATPASVPAQSQANAPVAASLAGPTPASTVTPAGPQVPAAAAASPAEPAVIVPSSEPGPPGAEASASPLAGGALADVPSAPTGPSRADLCTTALMARAPAADEEGAPAQAAAACTASVESHEVAAGAAPKENAPAAAAPCDVPSSQARPTEQGDAFAALDALEAMAGPLPEAPPNPMDTIMAEQPQAAQGPTARSKKLPKLKGPLIGSARIDGLAGQEDSVSQAAPEPSPQPEPSAPEPPPAAPEPPAQPALAPPAPPAPSPLPAASEQVPTAAAASLPAPAPLAPAPAPAAPAPAPPAPVPAPAVHAPAPAAPVPAPAAPLLSQAVPQAAAPAPPLPAPAAPLPAPAAPLPQTAPLPPPACTAAPAPAPAPAPVVDAAAPAAPLPPGPGTAESRGAAPAPPVPSAPAPVPAVLAPLPLASRALRQEQGEGGEQASDLSPTRRPGSKEKKKKKKKHQQDDTSPNSRDSGDKEEVRPLQGAAPPVWDREEAERPAAAPAPAQEQAQQASGWDSEEEAGSTKLAACVPGAGQAEDASPSGWDSEGETKPAAAGVAVESGQGAELAPSGWDSEDEEGKGPAQTVEVGAEGPEAAAPLVRCEHCLRRFNCESIEKHRGVCRKVFQQKRKAFDSAARRATEQKEASSKPSSCIPNGPVLGSQEGAAPSGFDSDDGLPASAPKREGGARPKGGMALEFDLADGPRKAVPQALEARLSKKKKKSITCRDRPAASAEGGSWDNEGERKAQEAAADVNGAPRHAKAKAFVAATPSAPAAREPQAAAAQLGQAASELSELLDEVVAGDEQPARGGSELVPDFHCTGCDKQVFRIYGCVWRDDAEYIFFRNNYPNAVKLKAQVKNQDGSCAYCCQCAWRSADHRAALADVADGLRWRVLQA